MEKVNVLKIETQEAQTSIKQLRKELMEMKNQMANLEEGGEEFVKVANKAGELKHQIDEINESIKGASSDMGDMIGNATNVAAGLVGAFQAVEGTLQVMGVESEAVGEALTKMQGLMAMTQGLSSIDDGIKAFDKLKTAINVNSKSLGGFKKALIGTGLGAIVVILGSIIANWDEFSKAIGISEKAMEKFGQVASGVLNVVIGYFKNFGTAITRLITGDFKGFTESIKEAWDFAGNYTDGVQKHQEEKAEKALATHKEELAEEVELLKAQIENKKALYGEQYENSNQHLKDLKEIYEKQKVIYADDAKAMLEAYTDYLNKKKAIDNANKNPSSEENTETTPEETKPAEDNFAKSLKAQADLYKKINIDRKAIEDENYANSQQYLEDMLYYYDLLSEVYKDDELQFEEIINKKLELVKKFEENTTESNENVTESIKTWQEEVLNYLKSDDLNNKMKGVAMVAQQTEQTINGLFNAISEGMDENSEEYRALQATQIVISTLTGIATAIANAMQLGPIAGPILGAINAGTVLTTGIISLTKLKNANGNTSLGGNTSAPTPNISSIIATNQPQFTQDVNGANIEQAINQKKDTKVYVLESDITSTQNKVEVARSENVY